MLSTLGYGFYIDFDLWQYMQVKIVTSSLTVTSKKLHYDWQQCNCLFTFKLPSSCYKKQLRVEIWHIFQQCARITTQNPQNMSSWIQTTTHIQTTIHKLIIIAPTPPHKSSKHFSTSSRLNWNLWFVQLCRPTLTTDIIKNKHTLREERLAKTKLPSSPNQVWYSSSRELGRLRLHSVL